MREEHLQAIKRFEGFERQAKWDYAQHTNGYGTRALHPGEQIDRAEAERRFADEIETARRFVEKQAAGWDEGTKAALTSLTFNAGTRWAQSGLGDAVRAQDAAAVKERLLSYTKAGGVDLPGLVRRRLEEASWIGAPDAARPAAPAAVATAANPVPASPAETVPAPAAKLGLGAPDAGSPVAAEISANALLDLLLDLAPKQDRDGRGRNRAAA